MVYGRLAFESKSYQIFEIYQLPVVFIQKKTRHDPTDPAALLEVSLVSLLMVRMLARVNYFAR